MLLGPVLAKAQSTHALEFFGRGDFAYRNLSVSESSTSSSFVKEIRDEGEKVAFLPAFGLRYRLQVAPRHSLGFGVGYSRMGYDLRRDELRWGSQWNGTDFDPNLPGEAGISPIVGERFSYIGIPVSYHYQISPLASSLSVHLGAGMEAGFFAEFQLEIQECQQAKPAEFLR